MEGSNKLVPYDLYHFSRFVNVNYKKERLTLSALMENSEYAITVGVRGVFSEDAIKGSDYYSGLMQDLYLDRNSLDLTHETVGPPDTSALQQSTTANSSLMIKELSRNGSSNIK